MRKQETKQDKMKFLLLVIIKFFFISALFIISNGNLDITNDIDRTIFIETYSSWINNLFDQGLEISGDVVNSQWLPQTDHLSLE